MRSGPKNSMKPITAPIIRFRKKVIENKEGCWIWQGHIGKKGYGTFFDGYKMQQAHRWSYMHYVEGIPQGLVMDHLCRNRACVNPEHLEPVTNQENCIRGDTGKHLIDRYIPTHCKLGHEFVRGSGCKICKKKYRSEWHLRNRDRVILEMKQRYKNKTKKEIV